MFACEPPHEAPAVTPIQLQQRRDQEDAWLRETVREHGWAVESIYAEGCWGPPGCPCGLPAGGEPPYAYTVGLFGFGHPEVVVFGLDEQTGSVVLNALGERVRRGRPLLPGRPLAVEGWHHRVRFFPFHDGGAVPTLASAQRFYRRSADDPVPALQCVWDDHQGLFPWEAGYDFPSGLQPPPRVFLG
ncbi:DUF4262 domain-containing protein [Jiangella gansuensis]|uniref:DUF4262 domain-containing protein n=1 Tax=Jiangella gansuensis TaxID=281473 RepID=UPI00047B5E1A|nr:DUF4262 domain-containing protein [Jiangella gansuensis]